MTQTEDRFHFMPRDFRKTWKCPAMQPGDGGTYNVKYVTCPECLNRLANI